MTLKTYRKIKLVFVFFLAMFFSWAIFLDNFLIPVAVMIASSLVLMLLRRQVKEIIADERDWQLAGKAALIAVQAYSWVAAILMFVLYSLRLQNNLYEPIALTLAFSTCALMLTYAFTFRFLAKYGK
jgi:uncharacterized membrane protein